LIRRLHSAVFLVLIIKIDQQIAMSTIRSQHDQNDEIWNKKRKIESVDLVKPLECGIEKMLADIVPNAPGGRESSESDQRIGSDAQFVENPLSEGDTDGKPIVRDGLTKSGAAGGSCDG
jgi:hypothetical protein